MTNNESAFLRNANSLISNDPILREGLLRVRLSEPFLFYLIFKSLLKSVEEMKPVFFKLTKTYLKLLGKHIVLLLYFG